MKDSIPLQNEQLFYIENQFILVGEPGAIDVILDMADVNPQKLQMVYEIAISDLIGQETPMPGLEDKRNYVIRQYTYSDDTTPIIEYINNLAQADNLGVFADFNYLIAANPWTAAGSPWTAAGSPWTAAGSPWTAAGSPWTAAGSPWTAAGSPWNKGAQGGTNTRQKALDIFYSQWAFGKNGMHAQVGPHAPQDAGQGVRVGVFDTSPFPITFSSADFNLNPDLHLNLVHPIPGGVVSGCGPGTAADHGLFVAGLIHALAPYSEIHLIRVLDDAAQGVLSILLAALAQFISDVNADSSNLNGAVINLSLGLIGSADEDMVGPVSLRLLLDVAHALNIVIVAAAGNDSAPVAGSHGPQIPASWDNVIGVAASNYYQNLACFANWGDIMAPGGSGYSAHCLPGLDKCRGKDCRYALISLSTSSWTGFSYGVGSSFAAPLVSGLVALMLAREDWKPCLEIKEKLSLNTDDGVVDARVLL